MGRAAQAAVRAVYALSCTQLAAAPRIRIFASRTKPQETGLPAWQGDLTAWLWMQCGSNRSPRGKFPSIREKNWEFCKFEGVAITCPRTNTRHFRRFSAKFPVRIEPGILLSNREFFLSNREISSAKTGNRRPSYARPFPTRGKGRLALAAVPGRNGNADSQITD